MANLIFVLSLILLIAGLASGYQSVDLLPTSTGVLYALAGAVAACAALVTFAIAVMVRRFDALAKLVRQSTAPLALEAASPTEPASVEDFSAARPAIKAGTPESLNAAPEADDESPININRAGHLPSLEANESETVMAAPEPQAPPSLIGSYSSAGANYKIFTDGSIEAETNEGTFKFASMAEFKRHLVETKGSREVGA
jgi:hypothetical protein